MDSDFGKGIKKARGSESVRSAAKGIGVSHTYLKTLENRFDSRNGKNISPSAITMYKISRYYKIEISQLFEWLLKDLKEADDA